MNIIFRLLVIFKICQYSPSVNPCVFLAKIAYTMTNIFNKNHTLYLNLILRTPADIKQYSVPYIKISILNALTKELNNTGNRQRVTIEKIVKNF